MDYLPNRTSIHIGITTGNQLTDDCHASRCPFKFNLKFARHFFFLFLFICCWLFATLLQLHPLQCICPAQGHHLHSVSPDILVRVKNSREDSGKMQKRDAKCFTVLLAHKTTKAVASDHQSLWKVPVVSASKRSLN